MSTITDLFFRTSSRIRYFLDWLFKFWVMMALLAVVWAAFPTGRFIQSVDFEIIDDRAIFVREVWGPQWARDMECPDMAWTQGCKNVELSAYQEVRRTILRPLYSWLLEGVPARWKQTITVANPRSALECNSGAWQSADYQPVPGNTIEYRMAEWSQECLDAGPPFYLTTTRQVMAFGWLPLRSETYRSDVTGVPNPAITMLGYEE